jgi:hypothetical protein
MAVKENRVWYALLHSELMLCICMHLREGFIHQHSSEIELVDPASVHTGTFWLMLLRHTHQLVNVAVVGVFSIISMPRLLRLLQALFARSLS